MLVTGITHIGISSVFLGANYLQNRTLESRFATLFGYTEEEIRENFPDYLYKMATMHETTEDKILAKLKDTYSGYCFSRDSTLKVFHPISINNALLNQDFENYWIKTEPSAPILIRDSLKKMIKFEKNNAEDMNKATEMLKPIDLYRPNASVLLWQAGFLTIADYNYSTGQSELTEIIESLKSLNIERLTESLMKLYKKHCRYITCKSEAEFKNSLSLILKCGNVTLLSQVNAEDGPTDLTFTIDELAFVVEIQFNLSPDKALTQIIDEKYYLRSEFSQYRRVELLGINYSTSLKTIDCVNYATFIKDQGVKINAKYNVTCSPKDKLLGVKISSIK